VTTLETYLVVDPFCEQEAVKVALHPFKLWPPVTAVNGATETILSEVVVTVHVSAFADEATDVG